MTLRSRLIVSYTTLFGVLLIGFSLALYSIVREERFSRLRVSLESTSEKLHSEIEEQVDRQTFPREGDIAGVAGESLPGVRYRLLDLKGGVILSDSLISRLDLSNPVTGHGAAGWSPRLRSGDTMFARLSVPLEIEGVQRFVLETVAPVTMIDDDLERLAILLILIVPLTLIAAGGIAAVVTRRVFRPVAAIVDAADRISLRRLEDRIPVPAAEDEIARLARALNRMINRIDESFESQRRFVADASHELRTPLTVIRGELDIALRSVADPAGQESILNALKEIDRLARLAEGLLTLARLDSMPWAITCDRVRLDEILLECIQRCQWLAKERGITFAVQIGHSAGMQGDGERLQSAILNLIDNAVKFSPDGASIECSLDMVDEHWRVSIKDMGPGIAADEIPMLFRRFYRSASARRAGQGAGLGLAIVDMVVQLHGGKVEVESLPGHGARFSLVFPRSIRRMDVPQPT